MVCLGTALVTGVGRDLHHWFDLCGPGHDTLDAHQFTDTLSFHISDRHVLLLVAGFEVDFTANERGKMLALEMHEITFRGDFNY